MFKFFKAKKIIIDCTMVKSGTVYLNFAFEVLWLKISIPKDAPYDPKITENNIRIFSGIRLCFIFAKSLSVPNIKNTIKFQISKI